jgi:hypothetical protein
VARQLIKKGFTRVYALKGGWREWKSSAFPIQKKLSVKQKCAKCHGQYTPKIVSDWQLSKHSQNEVSCPVCHGTHHVSEEDVDQVVPVKPDKCAMCHQIQGDQFKSGKHPKAWGAMKAAEIGALKEARADFGIASCDACHTRHTFSVRGQAKR